MEITVQEYADRRGCSARSVYEANRARKFGIHRGKLNPTKADSLWPPDTSATSPMLPLMSQEAIRWMQRKGLSQVATLAGVTRRVVEKWIQGAVTPRPHRVSQMIDAAAADGVTLRYEDFFPSTTTKKESTR